MHPSCSDFMPHFCLFNQSRELSQTTLKSQCTFYDLNSRFPLPQASLWTLKTVGICFFTRHPYVRYNKHAHAQDAFHVRVSTWLSLSSLLGLRCYSSSYSAGSAQEALLDDESEIMTTTMMIAYRRNGDAGHHATTAVILSHYVLPAWKNDRSWCLMRCIYRTQSVCVCHTQEALYAELYVKRPSWLHSPWLYYAIKLMLYTTSKWVRALHVDIM